MYNKGTTYDAVIAHVSAHVAEHTAGNPRPMGLNLPFVTLFAIFVNATYRMISYTTLEQYIAMSV